MQPIPKLITMVLLTVLGILGTYLGGFKLAIILILAFIALPPILAVVWKTQIGIYILITTSFFLSVGLRLIPSVPIGLFIDFLILLMLISKGYQLQHDREWSRLKSPLTVIILIWVVYNLAQIANPYAASRTAFFYVIRPGWLSYALLFYMGYCKRNQRSKQDFPLCAIPWLDCRNLGNLSVLLWILWVGNGTCHTH